jgi:hypothetical protein
VELRRRNLRLSRSAQAERISGAQSPLPATAGRGLG